MDNLILPIGYCSSIQLIIRKKEVNEVLKLFRIMSLFVLCTLLGLTVYQGSSFGYQPVVTWPEADQALSPGQIALKRLGIGQLKHVTATAPTPPPKESELTYIAHRGYSAAAPENTIPAFIMAFHKGADGVELDVQMTGDGYAVIFHDYNLSRTTNGRGHIKNKKLSDLKALDAGSWFPHGDYSGTTIPTYGEALDALLPYRKPIVYTEIKDYRNPADLKAIVDASKKKGWESRIVYSSFAAKDLELIRQYSADARIAFLCDSPRSCNKALASAAKASNAMIHASYTVLLGEPKLVEQAKQYGVDIAAWTVNKPEVRDKLFKMGVTTFITDQPEWLTKTAVN